MNMFDYGQGTIEYLVILAVVVVISLVVVGLSINVIGSPSQQISSSSDKLGNYSNGGISVVEAVIDSQGDALLKLNNFSSDNLTLTKISSGDVELGYNEQLVGLDSKPFGLNGLASVCPCGEGQKKVKCDFLIEYIVGGNTHSDTFSINADCVNNVAASTGTIVEPLNVVPSILLNSPANDAYIDAYDIAFVFTPNDVDGTISSCTLNVNNVVVGTLTNVIENTQTTIYDSIIASGRYSWNVSCTDNDGDTNTSETRTFEHIH